MAKIRKYNNHRQEFLDTVRQEIERLGIQDHPTKTVYDQLRGRPASGTIMLRLDVTWRELLGELGYETKPNRGNWRALSDEEFAEVVMKFMADHEVSSYPDYVKKISDDVAPGTEMIKGRFGSNGVSMLLERSFDQYGAPKALMRRRMWNTYTDDEILDHVHDEIETHDLTTVDLYKSSYDRLKAPSFSALVHHFGSRKTLYAAYRKKFDHEMFETSRGPRKPREGR